MNRKRQQHDMIELGSASVATKGGAQGTDDHFVGLIRKEGLSSD